jgi:hypothetical protein
VEPAVEEPTSLLSLRGGGGARRLGLGVFRSFAKDGGPERLGVPSEGFFDRSAEDQVPPLAPGPTAGA